MAAASTLEGATQFFVENKSLVSVVGDFHRNPKRVRMMATRLQIPFVFVTVSMVYTLLNGRTDYGFAAGIFYVYAPRRGVTATKFPKSSGANIRKATKRLR